MILEERYELVPITPMQEVKFTISLKTLFKFLGFLLFVYFIYRIWNILLLLFISVLLAALIHPFASWFQRKKIPRAIAVIIVYITMFGLLALTMVLLTPVVTNDLPQLAQNLATSYHDLQQNESVQYFWNGYLELRNTLGLDPGNGSQITPTAPDVGSTISGVYTTLTGFLGGIISMVLVLVITFYLVMQDDPLKKMLRNLIPDEYVPYLTQLFKRMRDKLGAWLRGQLLLSLIMGTVVFLGLFLLDVRYAAVLGLLAALMEFVPYLGPVFSGLPALIIAYTDGGVWLFIGVLAMYIVIHQLENHVLVPKVMQRAVGLNPVISIAALLIGAQLAGMVGVLLAIPVTTAASVFFKDVFHKR